MGEGGGTPPYNINRLLLGWLFSALARIDIPLIKTGVNKIKSEPKVLKWGGEEMGGGEQKGQGVGKKY